MKKIISSLLILLMATSSLGAAKIQNEDVKTLAQLISAGGTKANLINDTKIYVTANGINDQLSAAITSGSLGGNGGGGNQLLMNPSFENGTAAVNWTITTVAGANELSTLYAGAHSEKLTYSSSLGDIAQSLVPSVNTASINMEASCKVLTTLGTIQVCALSGGTEVQCVDVPATGTWQPVVASMIGPSNGTSVGVRVKTTTSTTGTVYVDDCYVGPNRSLSQVSQASLFGSIKWAGTASCDWSTGSAAAFTAFGADTDCPTPTVTGQASAPGTKIPAVVFPTMPAGTYYFVASGGRLRSSATVSSAVSLQLFDGTNAIGNVAAGASSSASANQVYASGVFGTQTYSSPQSNVTIQMRAKDILNTNGGFIDNDSTAEDGFQIQVYYYPSQSQIAARVDSGGLAAGDLVVTESATCPMGTIPENGKSFLRTAYPALFQNVQCLYGCVDGTHFNVPDRRGLFGRGDTAGMGGTITAISSNNATVTGHGMNHSGVKVRISASPPSGLNTTTTYYAIYIDDNTMAFANTHASALAGTKLSISGSTGTVVQFESPDASSRVASSTGGASSGLGTREEDAFQSHVHVAIDTAGGQPFGTPTGTIQASWTVGAAANGGGGIFGYTGTPADDTIHGTPRSAFETRGPNLLMNLCIRTIPAVPAPIVMNSVTSNTSGAERIERASLQTPSTILGQSGNWITSHAKNSTGNYTDTLAGTYSGNPDCTVTARSAAASAECHLGNSVPSTTSINVICSTAGSLLDSDYQLICMGPR